MIRRTEDRGPCSREPGIQEGPLTTTHSHTLDRTLGGEPRLTYIQSRVAKSYVIIPESPPNNDPVTALGGIQADYCK